MRTYYIEVSANDGSLFKNKIEHVTLPANSPCEAMAEICSEDKNIEEVSVYENKSQCMMGAKPLIETTEC